MQRYASAPSTAVEAIHTASGAEGASCALAVPESRTTSVQAQGSGNHRALTGGAHAVTAITIANSISNSSLGPFNPCEERSQRTWRGRYHPIG